MKSTDTVQSVERAIDLLFCFSTQYPELTLNDFVKKTGLSRTTVFRLLSSLKNKNLIIKNEHAGTYELGLPFMGFGQIVSEHLDIRNAALPIMKKLAVATKETISLNLIQDLNRVCIEKVEGIEDIRQLIRLGSPYPILKGASGKLLLAYSSQSFVEQVLQEQGKEDLQKEKLFDELKIIRNAGYAFSMNERVVGAFAISTPILGFGDHLLGGISISGLSARLNEDTKNILIKEAVQAAQTLSKQMGYNLKRIKG